MMGMQKRVVIGSEVYRLKFYINGWEESEAYFKDIGRFSESRMEQMASGETVERDGNTFCIRYENEYGNQYTVTDVLNGNV